MFKSIRPSKTFSVRILVAFGDHPLWPTDELGLLCVKAFFKSLGKAQNAKASE